MNYEEKIIQIKNRLDQAKDQRSRAEATLENLTAQKNDLLNELEALGVKPENLESEIRTLETDIERLINEAEEMLPKE